MTTCSKCGRISHPQWNGCEDTFCFVKDGEVCRAVAAAYRRGIRAGVELAKRTANPSTYGPESIDWTETDTEAAKMAGEG